jgi:catechol 2,3-dioxygenase-like lactoylglutathione lyase family enzyme
MIDAIDHIAVATTDLDAATAGFAALFGQPTPVAARADGAAATRFQLTNMALLLVAADGEGAEGDAVRAKLDAGGEGIMRLAFATRDLAETCRMLARRGLPSSPISGDHADLDTGATHGPAIRLIERHGAPTPRLTPDAVQALDHIVIGTPNPDRAVAIYGARLGLDFRLDRANPQWGARQIFFRCGGAVVEIGARLGAGAPTDGPDRLSGLAWRVTDPDAAQARIAKAGFDVSEVRIGRKPGTKIFTIRSGVPGAPTVMLSAEPATEDA